MATLTNQNGTSGADSLFDTGDGAFVTFFCWKEEKIGKRQEVGVLRRFFF